MSSGVTQWIDMFHYRQGRGKSCLPTSQMTLIAFKEWLAVMRAAGVAAKWSKEEGFIFFYRGSFFFTRGSFFFTRGSFFFTGVHFFLQGFIFFYRGSFFFTGVHFFLQGFIFFYTKNYVKTKSYRCAYMGRPPLVVRQMRGMKRKAAKGAGLCCSTGLES